MTSTRFADHQRQVDYEQSRRRYAIYARHRSAETAAAQVQASRQWLDAESRHESDVLVFADVEECAALACCGRPGYQAMLTAAKEGRFNALLIHSPSRISRDRNEDLAQRTELERLGIWLVQSASELAAGPSAINWQLFTKKVLEAFDRHRPRRRRVSGRRSCE